MLKVSIENDYFTHALKSFGFQKINSQLLQNWIKYIPRKKPKVFELLTLQHYMQFLITSQLKFYLKLQICFQIIDLK